MTEEAKLVSVEVEPQPNKYAAIASSQIDAVIVDVKKRKAIALQMRAETVKNFEEALERVDHAVRGCQDDLEYLEERRRDQTSSPTTF